MYNSLANHLAAAGSLDEAIENYKKVLELDKQRPITVTFMGIAYIRMGKIKEAEEMINQETTKSWKMYGAAMLEHAKGNPRESDRILKELKNSRTMAFQIAAVHAFRHEADSAFRWLDVAYEINDVGLTLLKMDRMFDNLSTDPRWNDLMKRMKYPEE